MSDIITGETTRQDMTLILTVRPSVTVLPRVLQILSRRGFVIKQLATADTAEDLQTVSLVVNGPVRWHEALPPLLMKLADVEAAETMSQESNHA